MTRRFILITVICLLLMSVQATFAASVTITPVTAVTFSVQGDAMDGVAGIDLTIIYDSSSLSSPTVNPGSLVAGSFIASNINKPGSIKIAIINTKAFSGSGQIATVTFASQSGTGGITSASVSMIDSKGSPITAQVAVLGGNASPATSTGLISTPGVPFSQPIYPGTVSMPVDSQPKSEAKPTDTTGEPVPLADPVIAKQTDPPAEVKTVAEPQKPAEIKINSYKEVLESFRVYKGEKSPEIFRALINKKIAPNIRQEPAVSLSDGKTSVKILAKLETAGNASPNFSLNGASLISLKRDASFVWIIEALPQAGIIHANLTILTDNELIEYPLTLAPPVEGISHDEAGFAVFLKDSGAATPKRDLNGDGRHDYQDDFIYTANYLMKKNATDKIVKPETAQMAASKASAPNMSGTVNVAEQKPLHYTLSAGETVSRPKLDILLKKLKVAGLQPAVREENKAMDVYRLVTGCFSAKTAAQKHLTVLARREKQAFIVHDTEQFCVVAASFFSQEAASTGQNSLAKKGLSAELVKTQVPLTSWQVTTGSYNDSQSAAVELKRLAERGINVVIVPLGK